MWRIFIVGDAPLRRRRGWGIRRKRHQHACVMVDSRRDILCAHPRISMDIHSFILATKVLPNFPPNCSNQKYTEYASRYNQPKEIMLEIAPIDVAISRDKKTNDSTASPQYFTKLFRDRSRNNPLILGDNKTEVDFAPMWNPINGNFFGGLTLDLTLAIWKRTLEAVSGYTMCITRMLRTSSTLDNSTNAITNDSASNLTCIIILTKHASLEFRPAKRTTRTHRP